MTPISSDGAEQQQWCASKFCFQLSVNNNKRLLRSHGFALSLFTETTVWFSFSVLNVSILPCFSACRRYVFGGRSLQILHCLRVVCCFVPHQGHAPEKSKICRRRLRRKLPADNSLSALPNGRRQSITPPLRSLALLPATPGERIRRKN